MMLSLTSHFKPLVHGSMPPHPLMRMRSRTSIRCGLVKRPVLYPEWRSMLSTKAAVDPLPFVPAMWMTFRLSRRSSRSRRWGGEQEGPCTVCPTTQSATARAPSTTAPRATIPLAPTLRYAAIMPNACSQCSPLDRRRPLIRVDRAFWAASISRGGTMPDPRQGRFSFLKR